MTTANGRALSLQQQYMLELIADQAALSAQQMMQSITDEVDPDVARSMGDSYGVMLLGAMTAVATVRFAYLQGHAAAEGVPPYTLDRETTRLVLQPSIHDVLVGGYAPSIPAPRGVGSLLTAPAQTALRMPSQQGAMWAALAKLQADLKRELPDALPRAQASIKEYTTSTVMATSDFVDRVVLGPSERIVALRRITHPTACDRCKAVAGILVFKENPRLRHPECKCSFEPVLINDPDHKARLSKYQANADFTGGGPSARDTRNRGRNQLRDAQFRETSELLKAQWTQFLRDEQLRLAKVVKTTPSNQYRDWAIMVSSKITTDSGEDFLPVITRI